MNKPVSWLLYAALVVLYILHNDLWLWNDSSLVFGIPVGLAYHIAFCGAAALLMVLLVRYAWPPHLDSETPHDAGSGK